VKAKTNSEKERLQQLNNEFNNLPEHLNRVMKNIINSICNQAVNKIYDAVNQLFNCYLDYLQKELETTAQNLSIQFPHYQLSQVERDLKFNFDLKANFAILEKLEEERIPMMKLCRTWWSLWLIEVPVSKIQYKKFYIDNANLPSTLDLLGGWILQAKQVEIEIVNQLAEWLLRQIDDLIKNVDNVQREIVDHYEDRLKKSYQEIQLDHQVQRELYDKIRRISDQMTEKLLDISWATIYESEE